MRSKVAQRMLAKMPEETKIFADKYADLVVLINQVLKLKGYSQKDLAEKLEKQPSEIHKWLNGDHNFTLKSIAKLEAELGVTLLEVPAPQPIIQNFDGVVKKNITVFVNKSPKAEPVTSWNQQKLAVA